MSTAEHVFVNAVIHTADRSRPTAEALAIAGGRIVAVGSRADVEGSIGPDTVVRDLGGAAIVPGLIDVHNHHLLAGESDLFQLTFAPTASFEDILSAVRDYAAGLGADEWVVGEAFGSTLIERLSSADARRALDDAAGGRPVALTDDSHHNKFVSTRALEIAGIGQETPDPEGGRIVRDPATGEPTGLLYESAVLPISAALAEATQRTPEDFRRMSARGIEILNGFGITAFQDAAATIEILAALRDLDERSELHAWVVSSLLSNEFLIKSAFYGQALVDRREEFRTTHHRPDFVKVALDGVPPTKTAAFLTPYRDSHDHPHGYLGHTTMPGEELEAWLLSTAAQGLGAKIHCTGDASVRVALDAIEAVRAAGHTGPKYQIAHGQYIHPDDRPRLAQLDVSADISPYLWFPGVIPDAISTVRPEEEGLFLQPNRELIDLGTLVAGGSDWPVSVSPNPWEGVQGLVTRADPLGRAEGTLWPEQAVTLAEALEIFTINGARAMGLDDVTGSLEAGKSADFVVLDQDPFAVPVDQIIRTSAVETWFQGAPVYQRS